MKHAHVRIHIPSRGGNVRLCVYFGIRRGTRTKVPIILVTRPLALDKSLAIRSVGRQLVCCTVCMSGRQERQQHCNVGSIGPGSRARGCKQQEGALAVFGVASNLKLFPIESLPASRHDPLPRIAPACLSGPP